MFWILDAPDVFPIAHMRIDGNGYVDTGELGGQADWQPILDNAYVRPKGASPVELSLVPAYQPCSDDNRTHGPPLAFPSCAPPQRTPGELTVGTADSNQRPTKSVSIIRMGVLAGSPSTPADEADIRLYGTVNDVRLASDLSDYTGALEAAYPSGSPTGAAHRGRPPQPSGHHLLVPDPVRGDR